MRAWRRAQHGEDLSEVSPDESMGFGPVELTIPTETAPFDVTPARQSGSDAAPSASEGVQSAALTAGNPAGGNSTYSPFRSDAATPPPREEAERPEPTTEQLVKRMTTAIERCHAAINPQFTRQFAKLPDKIRKRFLKALEQLNEKTAGLDE
jgi:hypothetical protein